MKVHWRIKLRGKPTLEGTYEMACLPRVQEGTVLSGVVVRVSRAEADFAEGSVGTEKAYTTLAALPGWKQL